jgi:hypothetical protein
VSDQNGNTAEAAEAATSGPVLGRDHFGAVDYDSLPDVIQWFLDYDQRVAIIKHPKVEELFQWKQEQSRQANEDVFNFNRAEDRLAIGIIQSVAHHPTEPELHSWIAQLLNALDRASKSTEDLSAAYHLEMQQTPSIVQEAQKIPAATTRNSFLIDCWLETLCTAEVRVLGWLYQEFYGRPFHPENF